MNFGMWRLIFLKQLFWFKCLKMLKVSYTFLNAENTGLNIEVVQLLHINLPGSLTINLLEYMSLDILSVCCG